MPPLPYPDATEDPLLSPKQVARQIGVSQRTVERYYHLDYFPGAFQHQRLIKIPQSGVNHYRQHGVRRP